MTRHDAGEFQLAMGFFGLALMAARETGDAAIEMKVLLNLGMAYSAIGNWNKAIDNLSASLALAKDLKNHNVEKNAQRELATAFYGIGNRGKAVAALRECVSIAQKDHDELFAATESLRLANWLNSPAQLAEAISLADYAQKTFKKINYPMKAQEAKNLISLLKK